MPVPEGLDAQRDFSAGELDPEAKRRDDVAPVKAGARQMKNFRARESGALTVRPGRVAGAPAAGPRTEKIRIAPTYEVYLVFSTNQVDIRALVTGVVIASNNSASYLWTNDTVAQINLCQALNDIVICFPGMRPQILRFTPATAAWSFVQFSFRQLQFQIQMPFRRVSVPGATMSVDNQIGSTNLTCSAPYFTGAMVGAVISLLGQQIQITSVTDPQHAVGFVLNRLPDFVGWAVSDATAFAPQQVVEGANYGRKAEICFIDPVGGGGGAGSTGPTVYGLLMDSIHAYGPVLTLPAVTVGLPAEVLVGPNGSANSTDFRPYGYTSIAGQLPTTVQWAEAFMGDIQGWPASCFFDRDRLGFCDFAQSPEAVLWSAVDAFDIFWIDSSATQSGAVSAGASADAAILEFVSRKPRVRHVVGWGDQFVFTDNGVFQIPITTDGNPLRPGSVEFRQVSSDGCSGIRPLLTQDAILYINAGLSRVSAVIATGSLTRPFIAQDATAWHSHLIKKPVALAFAVGDGAFPERYAYICNNDGTVTIGKFTQDKTFAGWVPWTGAGFVTWVSSLEGAVIYSTLYPGSVRLVEIESEGIWLDGAVSVNNPSAGMILGGHGPAWPFALSTVEVMDGARDFGSYQVDANGNILKNPFDDFSSPTLIAGIAYESILEPFIPSAPPSESQGFAHQRQRKRRVKRATVNVINSSGFTWCDKEIPPYNFGDDATLAPPLRETTYRVRPLGRDYDPRNVVLSKTRPGPLEILEVAIDVTV